MSFYRNANGSSRQRDVLMRHTASLSASPPTAAHRDPFLTLEELTQQLEDSAVHTLPRTPKRNEAVSSPLPPSWNAADVIALYLRQQRLSILESTEVTPASHESCVSSSSSVLPRHDGLLDTYSVKVLLLGDDAAVQRVQAVLRAADTDTESERCSGASAAHAAPPLPPPPELFTMPESIRGLGALRKEMCRWCDVVLLCYEVALPVTFVHLKHAVMPTVAEAFADCNDGAAAAQDDGAAATASAEHSGRSASLARAGVWPAAPPPLLLVGLGAEARLSRPTDLQAPWVTNAEVLAFAAAVGVQRSVEIYSHNRRHGQVLLQHCRTLREVGYEGLPSPSAQSRHAARKQAGLRALLRAPPPLLEVHPGRRTVRVVVPPYIPNSTAHVTHEDTLLTARRGEEEDGSTGEDVLGGVVRCCYAVTDAASPTSASLTRLVPESGVLRLADLYAAYAETAGRPAQHVAAIELTVCTAVSYLYPSDVARQILPTPAAPPVGYVDVVQRCCRVFVPPPPPPPAAPFMSPSLRDSLTGIRETPSSSLLSQRRRRRVLCTLDGAEVAALTAEDSSRQGTSLPSPQQQQHTEIVIPLDCLSSAEPLQPSRQRAGGGYRRGEWVPWPSAPAPSQPRQLQVEVVDDDEEDDDSGRDNHAKAGGRKAGGTQARRLRSSSAAASFRIPPVLPSPSLNYNAVDGSLTMCVPGYRADQVEIRYTLNGSVPTHTHGDAYRGAVYLGQQTVAGAAPHTRGGGGVVQVRAVAYPRLYFASPVASAEVDTRRSVAASPAVAPPFHLQDDEALLSGTPHWQWGSPLRTRPSPGGVTSPRSFVVSPSRRHERAAPLARSASKAQPHRTGSRGGAWSSASVSAVVSDAVSLDSDTPTTRSAQLRQAFNAGLYTPPRHPFSQGEGFCSPSPRTQQGKR